MKQRPRIHYTKSQKALLVALMALGFATLLLGMIVLPSWEAHASWNAYRDLTQQ